MGTVGDGGRWVDGRGTGTGTVGDGDGDGREGDAARIGIFAVYNCWKKAGIIDCEEKEIEIDCLIEKELIILSY